MNFFNFLIFSIGFWKIQQIFSFKFETWKKSLFQSVLKRLRLINLILPSAKCRKIWKNGNFHIFFLPNKKKGSKSFTNFEQKLNFLFKFENFLTKFKFLLHRKKFAHKFKKETSGKAPNWFKFEFIQQNDLFTKKKYKFIDIYFIDQLKNWNFGVA